MSQKQMTNVFMSYMEDTSDKANEHLSNCMNKVSVTDFSGGIEELDKAIKLLNSMRTELTTRLPIRKGDREHGYL